ncbi:MAG: hypothetical protein ACJ8LL_10525 [Candidatus Udaeobacter sp.]
MFNVYKITDAGNAPSSPDLMGLLIILTDDGMFLVDAERRPHEAPRKLGNALMGVGGPPFAQFKTHFKDLHWTLDVNTPLSSDELRGTWINRKQEHANPDDEDNWTAKGTGTGTGTGDDDEARAASATY